jgi:PiT family inorganic phosphate transporter
VLWAASFNFIAPFLFGVHVADTMGKVVNKEMLQPHLLQPHMPYILLAALTGAIMWNIITWYFGLPTSSSHALIGGFAGSALCASYLILHSMHNVLTWKVIEKISIFIVLAPVIGTILGFINMVVVMWVFKKASPRKIDNWFRRMQLVSAAAYSLGHGTNDAQKTMGMIAVLLATMNHTSLEHMPVPTWVIVACAAAIALGTMSGGWRIVKTMGLGITKLKPVGGFCAETAGAATILSASFLGIPVSTTHTITGAIVGVGATHRLSAVKWGVAGKIVWAWIITMPAAAIIAALTYLIIHICL